MVDNQDILIIGGYGEVGRRIAARLESAHPGRVVVAGRNPDRVTDLRSRRIDVDDPASIKSALPGVGTIVACVRQREPHLLRAAVGHGLAYTSIAPPWMEWPALAPLHDEAQRTGARIILATGLEPGISSVLARIAADRLGQVDAIETAVLLASGDAYGPDSLGFIFDELAQSYTIQVNGQAQPARAFGASTHVLFPSPVGQRRAYTMPFRDQLFYPMTLGARTAIARIAIEPPWVGKLISGLARLGAGAWNADPRKRAALERLSEKIRQRYADRNQFALVVEVRGAGRVIRSSLIGQRQADATAAGAVATAEALYMGEVERPGLWLAEQVLDPGPFLSRLAAAGLVPVVNER